MSLKHTSSALKLETLINELAIGSVLAILSSFARVLLLPVKGDNIVRKLAIIGGGICFGVVISIIMQPIELLAWKKYAGIAIASAFGTELFLKISVLIAMFPTLSIRSFLYKYFTNTKDKDDNDKSHS